MNIRYVTQVNRFCIILGLCQNCSYRIEREVNTGCDTDGDETMDAGIQVSVYIVCFVIFKLS